MKAAVASIALLALLVGAQGIAQLCDPKKAPPLARNIKSKSTTNSGDYSTIMVGWSSGTVKETDGCTTEYKVETYKKGNSKMIASSIVKASSPISDAEYKSAGLIPGNEYVYKITALNTGLQGSAQSTGSINSAAFMAAPKAAYCDVKKAPSAATDIKVDSNKFESSSGYSKVVMSWMPPKMPSGCATSWAVETVDKAANKVINTKTVDVSKPEARVTWSSTTLVPGKVYIFKIKGINAKAQGATSTTSVSSPAVTAAPRPTATPAH